MRQLLGIIIISAVFSPWALWQGDGPFAPLLRVFPFTRKVQAVELIDHSVEQTDRRLETACWERLGEITGGAAPQTAATKEKET